MRCGPAFFKPSPIFSGEIDVRSNHWYAFSPHSHLNGAFGEIKAVDGRSCFHSKPILIRSSEFAP